METQSIEILDDVHMVYEAMKQKDWEWRHIILMC